MINIFSKDLVKYLPAQIIPGFIGFITIPIITNLFKPEEYGIYILVISTIKVLGILTSWLSLSIIRIYPEYEQKRDLESFYSTVIKVFTISVLSLASIFSYVLIIFKPQISTQIYTLMWIGVPLFILSSCYEILLEFFRCKREISRYSSFKVWRSITAIGFGILFVVIGAFGIEGLILGSILSIVLAIPILYKYSIGKKFIISKNISISLSSELAKFGVPLVMGNLAAWILSLSDRYVLEFYRDSLEVGIYSACYSISEHSILLISSLFALTSGSIMFHILEKDGEKRCAEFLSDVTRYFLIFCIPAVVGLSVLAKPIIILMTSEAYHEGYNTIPFIASGAFFLGLQQRYHAGFRIRKKNNYIAIGIIISGILNLGLNFLLVPKYGYKAAAFTTLLSYIFLLLIMIIYSRRYFIWQFPFKTLFNSLGSAGIMGIAVYFIYNIFHLRPIYSIIIGVFSGFFIYLTMLFLFKEFVPEEKHFLRKIASKYFYHKLM